MLKKTLLLTILIAGISQISFADNTNSSAAGAITPTEPQKKAGVINNPNVSAVAASSQLFPDQNKLTGQKGQKYNTKPPKGLNIPNGKSFDNNNTDNSNQANSPTVSSRMYSGSQFPQQNKVTGHKKQTQKPHKNKVNNPNVNSRAYSGAQFPQQNSFNNDGQDKTAKITTSGAM